MTFQTILVPGYNWPEFNTTPAPKQREFNRKGSGVNRRCPDSTLSRLQAYVHEHPGTTVDEAALALCKEFPRTKVSTALAKLRLIGRIRSEPLEDKPHTHRYYCNEIPTPAPARPKKPRKLSMEKKVLGYIKENPGASKEEVNRHFLGEIEMHALGKILYSLKKQEWVYAKKAEGKRLTYYVKE